MSQIRFLSSLGTHSGPLEAVQVLDLEDDGEGGGDWITRLLSSGLFRRLPPENSHRFFAALEAVYVRAGEVVVEQGSPGDHFYVITQGHCAVTRRVNSSNRELQLHVLREGDAFGESALISRAPRMTTVRMLSDGALMRLDRERFEHLVVAPMLSPVSHDRACRLIDGGAVWLDVRSQDQRDEHVFDGSLNVPSHVLSIEAARLDRTLTYVVYCETGTYSSTGAFLLTRLGFDAHVLHGGLAQMRADAAAVARSAAQAPASPAPMTPQESPTPNTGAVDELQLQGDSGIEVHEVPSGDGKAIGLRQTSARDSADREREDRAAAAAGPGQVEGYARVATPSDAELMQRLVAEQVRRESLERQLDAERQRFLRKLRSVRRKLRDVRQEGEKAVSRLEETCSSQAMSLSAATEGLERVREAAERTERERLRLEQRLTEVGAELTSTTGQLAETKARLFESGVELSSATGKLQDAHERLTETKAKLCESDANLSSMSSMFADANDRLTMTTLKLADTVEGYSKVQARLAQAEDALRTSQTKLAGTKRKLASSQSDHPAVDDELAATKAKLNNALVEKEAEVAARSVAEAALEGALRELQDHIQGLAILRAELAESSAGR